ncbi:MAG: hypothetical protein ACR2L8_02310 [Solirubrobacteraceae bacterium]
MSGCWGSSDNAAPVAYSGDPWRGYAGTRLNFISENTAPTLAIAANLAPFTKRTGIEVRITQLELTALVQEVALDFASGLGNYHVIYADPYQILAPYAPALAPLNRFMEDASTTSTTSSPPSSTPQGASSTARRCSSSPTTPPR